MRFYSTFCWLLLPSFLWAQSTISNIHPQEVVKDHYKTLQAIDSRPNADRAWMDTIAFPPDMYNRYALALSMAEPAYLSSDQVEYLVRSVQFPANSSDQTKAELEFLMELQNNRSPEEVERVMYLAKLGYWPDANFRSDHPNYHSNLGHLFFECQEVVGADCVAANYPATSKLLQGIMLDMRIMEFAVKYHLLRPRPYILEPRLEQLQTMGSPSFASGHTIWAYIQAYTFAELMPDKRNDFLAIAYELGKSREIMGVHYPSDEETARLLAHRMLMLMWHTQTFQMDFAKAQAEWTE